MPPCDCPLGLHHHAGCPSYIDVWRTCPCPECAARQIAALPVPDVEGSEHG